MVTELELPFPVGAWVVIKEPKIKGRICRIEISHEVIYKVEYWMDAHVNTIACYPDELIPWKKTKIKQLKVGFTNE